MFPNPFRNHLIKIYTVNVVEFDCRKMESGMEPKGVNSKCSLLNGSQEGLLCRDNFSNPPLREGRGLKNSFKIL